MDKPTLLLFGENDKVTRKTRKNYQDNYVEDNITFKFIPDATHITPCTQTLDELSKLDPAIEFYRETHNLTPPKKQTRIDEAGIKIIDYRK